MQGGLVARKVSVRPSVCPSDKRVNSDTTEEKSVHTHTEINAVWTVADPRGMREAMPPRRPNAWFSTNKRLLTGL